MRRVHRSLVERLHYLAIYACKDCNTEDNLPRTHRLHLGKAARCPKCGTYRITRLKEPDRIDPMNSTVLNLLEKIFGGKLFHCRYCRIQFFDRRRLASEIAADEAARAAADSQPADGAQPADGGSISAPQESHPQPAKATEEGPPPDAAPVVNGIAKSDAKPAEVPEASGSAPATAPTA